MSKFKKKNHSGMVFLRWKLLIVTASLSLFTLLFAACNQEDERRLEGIDIANLMNAYAGAKANYEAGKTNTASAEFKVYQKKAGWDEQGRIAISSLGGMKESGIQEAAEKLAESIGCKYTVEIIDEEDGEQKVILNVIK